jgi:MATE family multidrug resistance protein
MLDHPTKPLHSLPRSKRVGIELKALWVLSWPILIGQLANVGMGVVDVAMAGHASAQDLAGVGLGVSIWFMVNITIMGIMMSVNPMVSHHVGAQEFDKVPHVVRQALWKALAIGLIAMVLSNLSALLFDAMLLEPQVRRVAKEFVLITSFGLPAFACYRVLYGYSASLNQTKPMMVVALAALVLNILINWLLVFGNLGFPRLGGVGCAWATLLCVWFNLAGLLWWMRRSPAYRSTWAFGEYAPPHRETINQLMRLGMPIGITFFAESSAFSLIALLIARFGSVQVGAHQIALSFTSLVFMVPLSLGLAVLTRVGQSLGAGDPVAARFQAWVGVGTALVLAAVSATGMALLSNSIANAFTNDPEVAALAASLLVWAAVFQLSDSTQAVTSSAIRGYKVTRSPMLIQLTAFWLVALPLGCVLGLAPDWLAWAPQQPMKAVGFWIALVVGLTVGAVGLAVLLRQVARWHLPAVH